jgi:adenosylcobinamide-GDP ribazoletransferase
VKRALAALAAAFSYFTVIPLGALIDASAPDALALSFLPLAGAVVGAIAGAVGFGVWHLTQAGIPTVIAAWIAGIALTGAIHVDGFLDSCDGLLVAAPPARRLEIVRDPHHGTFALVGMAMLSACWMAALGAQDLARLPLVLAMSGALARESAVLVAWIYPYARAGEVTRAFRGRPNVSVFVLSALGIVALAWWVSPRALVACALAPLVAVGIAAWAARRLGGGLVGDVYGAIVVVAEVVVLAVLPVLTQ